jgi:hypothetical protein
MLDGTAAARHSEGMKLSFVAFAAVALVGCAAEPVASPTTTSSAEVAAAPAFSWPVPAGWRSEAIPFPLGFAPTLPHRGTEELRFAPKFFDPKSPTYFTYSFAFVTEDTAPIPPAALATELTTYFRGLMSAVTGSPSDPSLHSATIVPDPQHDNAMLGTVHTIDGFGDKRALELHLEATTLACGNRQVVIASLSPRADDAIWTELRGVRASFTCAP